MGAGHSSPRTVTIDNDNPIGVVDVSEAVVQRLRGQHAKNRQSQQSNESNASPTQQQQQQPSPSSIPSSYPNPGLYPVNQFAGEHPGATITAIEVRRQKDQELKNNDLYWAKRLTQLEQSLQKTNTIMEKEYNAAIDDVRSRFQNAPAQLQLPPCKEFKGKLIECYKKYPNETLRCSQFVNEFTECVNLHKTKILETKAVAAAVATKPSVAIAAK